MPDIKQRQAKIQAKMKAVNFRDFLKHKTSRRGLVYNKHDSLISLVGDVRRVGPLLDYQSFIEARDGLLKYGRSVDTTQGFFEQFALLMKSVPWVSLVHYTDDENTTYGDCIMNSRNVYLSNTIIRNCENICYSSDIRYDSSNVFQSVQVINFCSNIYQSVGIQYSYNVFYSKYINNCNNIWFSTNLTGCRECILCNDLQNASFVIRNQQYSEEAYFTLKNQFLQEEREQYMLRYSQLEQRGINIVSDNVQGEAIVQSQNIENGYLVSGINGGKNVRFCGSEEGDEEFYNCFICGRAKHFYGINDAGGFSEHCYIGTYLSTCNNVYYSLNMDTCSYCLGCIGLKNKSFCIFNKQYEKEERFEKVDEIFAQMKKKGTLGDFFPGWMNPFYFNDTAAYLIDDSFTKEEVEAEGYLWRDEEIKVDIPEGVEVVNVEELGEYEEWKTLRSQQKASDTSFNREGYSTVFLGKGREEWDGKILHIDPSILSKVIRDKKGNYYRIVKMEYDFLVKHGLPLPRLHRLDRLKQNFRMQ